MRCRSYIVVRCGTLMMCRSSVVPPRGIWRVGGGAERIPFFDPKGPWPQLLRNRPLAGLLGGVETVVSPDGTPVTQRVAPPLFECIVRVRRGPMGDYMVPRGPACSSARRHRHSLHHLWKGVHCQTTRRTEVGHGFFCR